MQPPSFAIAWSRLFMAVVISIAWQACCPVKMLLTENLVGDPEEVQLNRADV